MILYNALPEKDLKTIETYAKRFSSTDFTIGTEKFLNEWDSQKRKLYKLLGEKMIYEFPIELEREKFDLEEFSGKELEQINFMLNFVRKIIEEFKAINNSFYLFGENIFKEDEFDYFSKSVGYLDKSDEELIFQLFKNICYFNRSLHNKDGKVIAKTTGGMKLSKAIKIYVEILTKYFKYDSSLMEDYEKFRIFQSMLIQKGKVTGTLCISIHPMDFMTMSDNDNNWSSCMSWKEIGCYRAGTLEMMNSNNVLVAYLKASNRYTKITRKESWNSKIWRTLIVFTKHAIISGKQYPYCADELSKAILDKIKELAEKNLNWNYEGNIERYIPDASQFKLKTTGIMYNDFMEDNDYNHFYLIKRELENHKDYTFSFSGKIYCLECGNRVNPKGNKQYEEFMLCSVCRTYISSKRCVVCGDRLKTYIKLDNDNENFYACRYCYEQKVGVDIFTNEEIQSFKIFFCPCKAEINEMIENDRQARFWLPSKNSIALSEKQINILRKTNLINFDSGIFKIPFSTRQEVINYIKPLLSE